MVYPLKKKKSDSSWHSYGTSIPHEGSLMRIIQTEKKQINPKEKKFMPKREIFNDSMMSILQNLIQITGNAFPNWNISSVSQLLHHYVFIMSYLKVASTTSETIYPSQVLNRGYSSTHTGLKWWCYFQYQGPKRNELKMLNVVQVLVTPQEKHIPSQINLGTKTFESILQSTTVWHIVIVLLNNATGCEFLQYTHQIKRKTSHSSDFSKKNTICNTVWKNSGSWAGPWPD